MTAPSNFFGLGPNSAVRSQSRQPRNEELQHC